VGDALTLQIEPDDRAFKAELRFRKTGWFDMDQIPYSHPGAVGRFERDEQRTHDARRSLKVCDFVVFYPPNGLKTIEECGYDKVSDLRMERRRT